MLGGRGDMGDWILQIQGTLSPPQGQQGGWLNHTKPGAFPPLCPPAVDDGITLEKELSKDELVAVLKLYREAGGANSDIAQLLKILSQLERYEVGSPRASSEGAQCKPSPTVHPLRERERVCVCLVCLSVCLCWALVAAQT